MTPQHSRRRPKERSAALPLRRKAFPRGRREAGQRQRTRPVRGVPRPSARCIFIPLTSEISVMRQLVLLQQREKGYRWEFEA